MATTSTSTAVTAVEQVFTEPERLALAGFLAGYTGLTREAYALDLRQYANWCQLRHLRLFQARRADIECFARDMETRGRARATIIRRTQHDRHRAIVRHGRLRGSSPRCDPLPGPVIITGSAIPRGTIRPMAAIPQSTRDSITVRLLDHAE